MNKKQMDVDIRWKLRRRESITEWNIGIWGHEEWKRREESEEQNGNRR